MKCLIFLISFIVISVSISSINCVDNFPPCPNLCSGTNIVLYFQDNI